MRQKSWASRQRIKTLVNDGADEKDVLLAAKRWLARGSLTKQTSMSSSPVTALQVTTERRCASFHMTGPQSCWNTPLFLGTVFLRDCPSQPLMTVFLDATIGTTRGPDMLIASRPIAIRAKEQALPEGFTVMTAAAGDQTAKPLEEAKHGMFSYFLMKGMEGDADANQDNQITAGELHAYVQQNVIQQSSGSQTPELQGDAERVLVRFQ